MLHTSIHTCTRTLSLDMYSENSVFLSIGACHSCPGATPILLVFLQFYRMPLALHIATAFACPAGEVAQFGASDSISSLGRSMACAVASRAGYQRRSGFGRWTTVRLKTVRPGAPAPTAAQIDLRNAAKRVKSEWRLAAPLAIRCAREHAPGTRSAGA